MAKEESMNEAAEELIPVRALNQVSYCPRLYYLEYVEAVMPTNEYVEDGLFQHRRVNDPALASRTRKEGDALRTRSVALSSQKLGITAKLDVLEEAGRGDPARGDQAVRGAQGRQRRAHLLAERRHPALRPGAPRRGGFRGHGGQRSPVLRGIQDQGRRSPGPRSPRGNPGRDRPDSRPLLAGNTAGAATPRAPPPLLRLLAGDHLPSRGNALFDPALRARARAAGTASSRSARSPPGSRSPASSP